MIDMKRLLLILLVTTGVLHGQSLQVASADTVVYGNAYNTYDMASHINITNTTNRSMDVLVKRLDVNYNGLTDSNAICWGVCFQPDVSVSPISISIGAGQTTDASAFIGHVYPDRDGIAISGDITYVFFDMNNPNDSVAFTVTYELQQTFSVPSERVEDVVKVFPNPAKNKLNVSYDLRGGDAHSFELISLVGKVVYHKELATVKGELNLDLSKLSRGIYFYVLRSDGEALITRKLVVE